MTCPGDVVSGERRRSILIVGDSPDNLLQSCDQRRQVLCHYLPDDVLIHAHAVVHDLVAHADNLLPRDLGMLVTELTRYVSACLTNNLNKMREG